MRRVVLQGLTICFVGILLVVSSRMSMANERVALVIGNSNYMYAGTLPNPHNDATDISVTLRKLGFKVTEGINLDKTSMDKTIREFTENLQGAQVALFFYAGHGLQYEGQNYLVPVDAKLASRGALGFETVRLDLIQNAMESEANTNIIMLDACRNNPLGRNLAKSLGTRGNVGPGLALVESGEGTLISFSTQPGNVAMDGSGRNSPYAAALLAHINTPGADLSGILINIRNDVMRVTERKQIPWEHSALTAPFYFVPPKPAVSSAAQLEIAFWNSVKDSTSLETLQAYLDKYPDGTFVPLAKARIGQLKQMEAALASKQQPATKVALTEETANPINSILQEQLKTTASLPKGMSEIRKAAPTEDNKKEQAAVPLTVNSGTTKTNLQTTTTTTTETSVQSKVDKKEVLDQERPSLERQKNEKRLKAEKIQNEKKEIREAEKLIKDKKAHEKRAEKLQRQDKKRAEKLEREKKKLARAENEKQEEKKRLEKLHREKQAEHKAQATKVVSCGSGQVSDGSGGCVTPPTDKPEVKETPRPKTAHWENSWNGTGR